MSNTKISKYIFSQNNFLAAAGLMLVTFAGYINLQTEKPIMNLSKQDTALNIHKDLLIFFSAGHKRLLTDLLWIQTLIESDLEHYDKKDLNNWLFLRFNTMAELDKLFYENYLYGGLFLGVVKDDLEGADEIYSKGLRVYPEDYRLNYNAGFLRYFELGKIEEALVSLQKIRNHRLAPLHINSIINKLLLATGVGREEVFEYVLHNYRTTQDTRLKEKLKSDLYSIKAEIDLTCLNNGGETCSYRDFEGNPYVRRSNAWYSPRPFLPYRINQKKRNEGAVPRANVDTFK